MAPLPKHTPPPAPSLPAAASIAPTSFPLEACGPQLEAAVTAVAARTQAAPELIAHHLLTLAAMAAQRLISLRLPTGLTQPVSCYFLTLAGSGEGRSATETLCVGPIRQWHDQMTTTPGGQAILLSPHRAGAHDRYARFARCCGAFAGAVADLLTTSHARSAEARSFCALWDGSIRASSVVGKPAPPRLSVHLVLGAGEGLALLHSADAADAGLIGRVLAVQPASRIGAREFLESDGAPPPPLCELHAALIGLYGREATCESRIIDLNAPARAAWLAFAHEAEAAMASDGLFAAIRPLAGRLAEHAARLAALLAFVENDALTEITPQHLARGVELARYYAAEALRLAGRRGPARAEKELLAALEVWLTRKYAGAEVSLRDVYCCGPGELRSAPVALRAMRQLEMLGFIEPVKASGAQAKGLRWRVAEPAAAGPLQHTAA